MKRIYLYLMMTMLLSVFIFDAHAEINTLISSGACGGDVIWNLDSEGNLTLSGEGSTYHYNSKGSPWYSYRSEIKKIIIEDGISELQSYLFEDLDNLSSVSFPESVTGVLPYTFANCTRLESVYLPSNLFGYPMGPVFIIAQN